MPHPFGRARDMLPYGLGQYSRQLVQRGHHMGIVLVALGGQESASQKEGERFVQVHPHRSQVSIFEQAHPSVLLPDRRIRSG